MKLSKHCISSAFGIDLVSGGGLWLPKILLQNYAKLDITNLEMMLLVHLICTMSSEATCLDINRLSENMNLPSEQIYSLLASLEAKGIIRRKTETPSSFNDLPLQQLSLEGVFEKLLEVWGCQKAKVYETNSVNTDTSSMEAPGTSRVISNLYRCFEKEFGRPLSPIESTQLMEWYYGDKYTSELIIEALKRAVLRGVVNLKYIDSILRGWSKNNLKTVKAIMAFEEAFIENKRAKNKRAAEVTKASEIEAADLDSKYNDIYLT